ncbi:TlpA disulfide reductase family protein [Rhizomicrobium palustre]
MGYRSMQRLLLCLMAAMTLVMMPANAADLDLSAYKGKVVYLDFWASWCTPCRLSFPWLNELQRSNETRGLVVIAVNVDHDKALADEFLKRFAPQFKVVYDPSGDIARKYGVREMPTSFVIDRSGHVRFTHAGFFPNQTSAYSAHIEELLHEQFR